MMKPSVPVVVAGSRFGQFYAVGVSGSKDYELAGIVGRGSIRTAALARRLSVPVFSCPTAVPSNTRLACVAVGGATRGMSGVKLACQFLEQGIDVLIEHPLLPQEWEQVMRQAQQSGHRCLLNSFYRHLSEVAKFIDAARTLHRRGAVRHIDMVSAVQVSYSALDIVGAIVECVSPWSVESSDAVLSAMRDCIVVMGETPISLRVLNELAAGDDGCMNLLMRISLLTDNGTLTLVSPHGPLIWEPAIDALPVDDEGLFSIFDDTNADLTLPSVQLCQSVQAPDWGRIHRQCWPQAAVYALSHLESAEDLFADNQRSLDVAVLWQQLTNALGFPAQPDGFLVPRRWDRLLEAAR